MLAVHKFAVNLSMIVGDCPITFVFYPTVYTERLFDSIQEKNGSILVSLKRLISKVWNNELSKIFLKTKFIIMYKKQTNGVKVLNKTWSILASIGILKVEWIVVIDIY